MKAERFHGNADGPELVIDRAGDGTPLEDCHGWTCGCCETIFATRVEAEACCGGRPGAPGGKFTLRLFVPEEC